LPDAGEIRQRLDKLGKRRRKLAADEAQLMEDTEKVLRDAYEVVPVSEQARRLGIHRTTIYRVYDPQRAA
jgi:DNA invertase Pin-like site-specific DNA recombinase